MDFIADIAKVLGLFSIILVYLNYRKSLRWRRFDYSIKVINKFRSDIIPKISKANKQFPISLLNKRNQIFKDIEKQYIKDHPKVNRKSLEESLKFIRSKSEFNGTSNSKFNYNVKQATEKTCYYEIINEFEELAIYDAEHLINDNLAYLEMHAVFLRFFKKHKSLLNYLSSQDATYFACHYLIKKWIIKKDKNILTKARKHLK